MILYFLADHQVPGVPQGPLVQAALPLPEGPEVPRLRSPPEPLLVRAVPVHPRDLKVQTDPWVLQAQPDRQVLDFLLDRRVRGILCLQLFQELQQGQSHPGLQKVLVVLGLQGYRWVLEALAPRPGRWDLLVLPLPRVRGSLWPLWVQLDPCPLLYLGYRRVLLARAPRRPRGYLVDRPGLGDLLDLLDLPDLDFPAVRRYLSAQPVRSVPRDPGVLGYPGPRSVPEDQQLRSGPWSRQVLWDPQGLVDRPGLLAPVVLLGQTLRGYR